MQITNLTAGTVQAIPAPLFYRQDPGIYGSLTILSANDSEITAHSSTKEMEFTFSPDDLYTAAELAEEAKSLALAGDEILYRKVKIESRISCLLQAIFSSRSASAHA